MERTVGVRFGAMAPPLAEQFAEFEIAATMLEHWQYDADAIVRLHLRGIMTETETRSARKRLWKRMWKEIRCAPLATRPTPGGSDAGR